MKNIFLLICLVLVGSMSFASVETKTVFTRSGTPVQITLSSPSTTYQYRGAILIAPGQGCNSKSEIFESLFQGDLPGFIMARFEWSYCGTANPNPSPDLKKEIEEYITALEYVKSLNVVDPSHIVLAGKSLGSIVAYSVFQKTPEAKALVLLTPVCSYTTDENGKPLPAPLNVCDENYPNMKKDSRPILMLTGEKDKLCILNILFDYLKDSNANINVNVVQGDHGLRVLNADGSVNASHTTKNIKIMVQMFLNWVDFKTNF